MVGSEGEMPRTTCKQQCIYRCLYGCMNLSACCETCCGKGRPRNYVEITLDREPNSVFVMFRIVDKARFEKEMLGDAFELAPCRMTASDVKGEYWVALNAYKCEIATLNSTRCEVNVFVRDKWGGTTFLVQEAFSSLASYDSDKGCIGATTVEHSLDGDSLATRIDSGETHLEWTLAMDDPRLDKQHLDLIAANDRVLWRSGLVDEIYSNSRFSNADICVKSGDAVDVQALEAPWAHLVDPRPAQVFWYRTGLQFLVRPGANIWGHDVFRRDLGQPHDDDSDRAPAAETMQRTVPGSGKRE